MGARLRTGSSHGLSTPPADDWRTRAACRDEDPELFFPVGTSGPALVQAEQAKAVCRRCDVSAECLDSALTDGHTSGVWGATTERERQAIRTARNRARRNRAVSR